MPEPDNQDHFDATMHGEAADVRIDPESVRASLLDTLHDVVRERQAIDQREFQTVYAARQMRITWSEIADALGVSQPAAHSRFARRVAALEVAAAMTSRREAGEQSASEPPAE